MSLQPFSPEHLRREEVRNAREAGFVEGRRVGRDETLNDLARIAMRFDAPAADAIWEAIGLVRQAMP